MACKISAEASWNVNPEKIISAAKQKLFCLTNLPIICPTTARYKKIQEGSVAAFSSIRGKGWCGGFLSRSKSLIFCTIKNMDIHGGKKKDKTRIQLGPLDPVNCNSGMHVGALGAKMNHCECLSLSSDDF